MIATGTRLGSYEVGAQIGAGGMGEVYEAEDLKLHRHVALKFLPDEFAKRKPLRVNCPFGPIAAWRLVSP